MFSRMIIASEISSVALEILNRLEGLRKLGAKECLLVQCINPHEVDATISNFYTSILEQNLAQQKAILEKEGYAVESRVVTGLMKNEIDRIAAEENFSVIVAAAQEHSLMGEVFFGGPAHEVIHKASKPVLLVRVTEETRGSEGFDIADNILFPTDFSDNAAHAFEYVKKIVADGAKKVTLVHVQDRAQIEPHLSHRLEEFNAKDTARLQDMKKALEEVGNAEIEIQLLYGKPSAELIRLIKELEIHLVVMGSQGRGFAKELYLGSVSHNVARHSGASVLLIPAKR